MLSWRDGCVLRSGPFTARDLGTLSGILTAPWGSMKDFKPTAYALRVSVIAAIFASLTLLQFLV
jgi:hypothetical protein